MEYTIVRAAPETGQIEVQYTENGKAFGVYIVDVPIVDGAFLTGQALHNEIMHRAPTWAIEREHAVKTATGFDAIEALVKTPAVPLIDKEARANAEMWMQVEYEKKLAKALVKFGLLESDPTTIPVRVL